jgi:hypothetical protein
MATAFFLLLSLLGSNPAFASWSTNFGGQMAGTASVKSTATDASGNVYVVGETNAVTLSLGGWATRQVGKNTDAFVVKRATDGTVLWIKRFGGNAASVTAKAYHVKVDASGNVYVVGTFAGGSLTEPALTSIGTEDTFVVKLDEIGNTVWAKNFGGSGANRRAQAPSVAVDGSGNVFVGGYFQGGDLTTPALTLVGFQTSFLLKLDSTGNTVWANSYGNTEASQTVNINDLAVDSAGNVYAAGSAYGTSINTGLLPALALPRPAASNSFALKIDTNGASVWSKAFGGGTASMSGNGIAVDGSNNVYLAGHFNGGNTTVPAMTRSGTSNTFAIKLNSSGTDVWAKNQGGTSVTATTEAHAVAVDASGNVFLTGYFTGGNLVSGVTLTKVGTRDGFALKLDSSGNTTWATNYGGASATVSGFGISTDASGNTYLGGSMAGADITTPAAAALSRSLVGATDGLLLKLDTTGAVTQANVLGGNAGASTVTVRQTLVDSTGNVYITGMFNALSMNLGGTTLTRIGTQDAFAAKYDAAGTLIWAHNYGGVGATVEGYGIHVDSAGLPYISGLLSNASLTTPVLAKHGSSSNREGFVIKLDAVGANPSVFASVYSTATAPNNGQVSSARVRVDSAGNVYVAGEFTSGNLTSPAALTKLGSLDAYLFKFDAAGALQWSKSYGGASSNMFVNDFDIDASGNAYLGGSFVGSNLTTPPVTKVGSWDGYAMKIDTVGTFQWLKQFAGAGTNVQNDSLRVIGTDVFVGGTYTSANMTLVASVDQSGSPLALSGVADFYAAKLDTNGALTWIQRYGGAGATSQLGRLGTAGADTSKIYLGGYFSGADLTTPALTRIGAQDIAVLTLDTASGAVTATHAYGGSGAKAQPTSIAGDANTFVVAGDFRVADLTTPSHALVGQSDGLVISQTSSAFTGVPSAPSGATAVASGSGQATITFTAPLTNGGSAITTYTATSNPGGFTGTCAGPAACSITVSGLTNGTIYTFSVTASNANGTGSASPSSNSVINAAATAPGAPTSVAGTAGDAQASLSWTAPASNGGAAISGYRVQVATSAGGVYADAAGTCAPATTGISTAVICTATGLTNGTAYFFKVAAINSVGTGSYSTASSGVTPVAATTVPGAPTSVGGTAGDSQASVSWTAPASNGGAAISGYRVQVSTSAGGVYADAAGTCAFATTGTSTALTCTATGLTNGTAYFFKVAAINSVGTGSYSTASSGVTPVAAAVNGVCGVVAATAFTPTAGLCTQGTPPGAATAGSPWTWTCTGSGVGHTDASCSAPNQSTATNTGTGRATVAATNGWVIDTANSPGFVATSTVSSLPPGYDFPHGLFNVRLTTGAANSDATITINYPSALAANTVYWKYGPTASNPTAHWYIYPANKAVISSDRLSITLTLTDNADGDDAYTTNSVIEDPSGPGAPSGSGSTSIPTLSEWGLIALVGLMGLFGLRQVRRRGSDNGLI